MNLGANRQEVGAVCEPPLREGECKIRPYG